MESFSFDDVFPGQRIDSIQPAFCLVPNTTKISFPRHSLVDISTDGWLSFEEYQILNNALSQ